VETVELSVVSLTGRVVKFIEGDVVGHARTKDWLKPGVEFRLNDVETGELLATATVGGNVAEPASSSIRTELASLTVSPATVATSDKVDGHIEWDVRGSGIQRVEISVVSPDGNERTFARGGLVGQATTKGWHRPHLLFHLKDADTGEVVVSTTVVEPEQCR
jgi:hypothetical protein